MPKVYLSPSTQQDNIGYENYGSEEFRMNEIADAVERYLCCKKDQITIYRNSPNMTLSQIVADSNAKKPDIHVAIHSNASGDNKHTARGAMGFAYKKGTKGDALANDVYDEVAKVTPTNDFGVNYSTSLYELSHTTAPATLIEVGFHDNPQDAKFIMDNIEKIGSAIARGILKNLNIRFRSNNYDNFYDHKGFIDNKNDNKNFNNPKFNQDKNVKFIQNPFQGAKCIRLMILYENEANLKSAVILSNRYAAPMINIRYARRYLDKVNSFIIVGRDNIGIKDSFRIDEGNSLRNLEKVLNFVKERAYDFD